MNLQRLLENWSISHIGRHTSSVPWTKMSGGIPRQRKSGAQLTAPLMLPAAKTLSEATDSHEERLD
jgi:hypothetical protein